jgi:dipeptidyl aminopeptidase/acylaminoacyl peptidase
MEPIAFVGNDRHLYLWTEGTDAPRCLSADDPDGAYVWPTWHPTGQALAVMRLARAGDDQPSAVHLRARSGGPSQPLWSSAAGGPVYLGWAPDGSALTLLVQDPDTLHIVLAPRDGSPPAAPLVSGAPLYWSWASDSTLLAVHVGGHHARAEGARVLLLPPTGAPSDTETLTAYPLGFRAPAWEPGTRRVAYAATLGTDRRRLVLTDTATRLTEELAPVANEPAFVWAPQGRHLLLADRRAEAGTYQRFRLVDTATGAVHDLSPEPVAVCWTPAGDALICAVANPSGDGLAWLRLDPDTGRTASLASFTPGRELALLLGHFDQYADSHRLHSAVEPVLLAATRTADGRQNGHTAARADIWLVPTTGAPTPRHLTPGTHAFFAPQPSNS